MYDKKMTKAWEEYRKTYYAVEEASRKFAATMDMVNNCAASGTSYLTADGKPNRTYTKWIKANNENKKVLSKAREKFLKVCSKYCINPETPIQEVKAGFVRYGALG